MKLNKEYYQLLWDKFKDIKTLGAFSDNISCLTTKIILEHYRNNKALHFNFQNAQETIFEIGKSLFLDIANDIFINHYDLPTLKIGDKLRDKRKYADGKKHDYLIKAINNVEYILEDTKNGAKNCISYDNLVKNFIPIGQGTKQKTLQGYTRFFSDLNNGIKLDFTPTFFEKKIVFITKKALWDELPNKNKIPITYLPNPIEREEPNPIKTIPALPDCIAYFTPNYNLCYQNILLKGEKIKTIIVFDTQANSIQQMLQDTAKFEFNLIVLSNSLNPIKIDQIPCWNWFKEEIEIVNSL